MKILIFYSKHRKRIHIQSSELFAKSYTFVFGRLLCFGFCVGLLLFAMRNRLERKM